MKTPWLNGIYGCIIQAVIIFRKQKMYSATQRVDNLEVFKMDVSGAGRNEVSRSRVALQHLHSIYLFTCLWLQYELDDISSVDAGAAVTIHQ